jgi:hypothetical protein
MDNEVFSDLVHVAKMTVYLLEGDKVRAVQEFDMVQNRDVLPDWDDVDVDDKVLIYREAWSQIGEQRER